MGPRPAKLIFSQGGVSQCPQFMVSEQGPSPIVAGNVQIGQNLARFASHPMAGNREIEMHRFELSRGFRVSANARSMKIRVRSQFATSRLPLGITCSYLRKYAAITRPSEPSRAGASRTLLSSMHPHWAFPKP